MKLYSWNVAGVRAVCKKGFMDWFNNTKPDILCLQEIKATKEQLPSELKNLERYGIFLSSAERKGYSGVMTITRLKPLNVIYGIDDKDTEGRVLTLEFNKFVLINAYFPHSHRELIRLDYKLDFNKKFEKFCEQFSKPIIIAADFNVAHKEIDLKNSKQNVKNAGFTEQERNWFDNFLKKGFVDSFREFDSSSDQYTWWPYMHNARSRNIGWRIDYFLTKGVKLKNGFILKDVLGSDHCPIGVEVE